MSHQAPFRCVVLSQPGDVVGSNSLRICNEINILWLIKRLTTSFRVGVILLHPSGAGIPEALSGCITPCSHLWHTQTPLPSRLRPLEATHCITAGRPSPPGGSRGDGGWLSLVNYTKTFANRNSGIRSSIRENLPGVVFRKKYPWECCFLLDKAPKSCYTYSIDLRRYTLGNTKRAPIGVDSKLNPSAVSSVSFLY